jgi:hypothetical protein
MGRLAAAVALVVVAALPVLAADRLVIRLPTNGDPTLVWTLGDGVVPISKGSGGDPNALSVRFEIAAAGATSALLAGLGAFDGTIGWVAVSATRARFRDRSADAPVRATVIREGRKLRISSGSPGPVITALAAGPPSEPVSVRYRVSNGGEQIDHCVVYPTCTYLPVHGVGFRLDCLDAEAETTCGGTATTTSTTSTTSIPSTTSTTVIPGPCGNGVRNTGEPCDGGAYCTTGCTFPSPSPGCCQEEASCRPADGFVLFFSLFSFCGGSSFEAPVRGGVCSAGGTCDVLPIDDVPLCCQLADSCSGSTANDTSDLWNFRNICVGAQSGTVVHAAVCGPTGLCEPG